MFIPLGKSINPIILPLALNKSLGIFGFFFNLGIKPGLRDRKFTNKTVKIRLKITLCHIPLLSMGYTCTHFIYI